MEKRTEYFDVIRLAREDFENVGFNGNELTDAQMQRIADRISEVCMEQFWISLEFWAEEYKLPAYKGE
jgi:hypothetical protein